MAPSKKLLSIFEKPSKIGASLLLMALGGHRMGMSMSAWERPPKNGQRFPIMGRPWIFLAFPCLFPCCRLLSLWPSRPVCSKPPFRAYGCASRLCRGALHLSFFGNGHPPLNLAMSPSNVGTRPVLPSIMFLGSGCARRRVSSATPGNSADNGWPRHGRCAASRASGCDTR